jgi:hypothetical protein
MNERRLLQIAIAVACLVPLAAGGAGVVLGPDFLRGVGAEVPADLDSHFRYLSGIFLGVGIAFVTCVPGIERKGARFRLLGGFVIMGGLARLISVAVVGWPGGGHLFGLVMELGFVPLLILWQARVARAA